MRKFLSMPRNFRRIDAEEAPLIHALWQLHQQCVNEQWSADAFQRFLQLPTVTCYALCDQEHPIAALIAQYVQGEADLIAVFVKAKYRRLGIGRELMLHFLTTHQHLTAIHLEVRATNRPAISLYKAMGFKQTGKRTAYYKDGADALFMTKTLASD